MGYDVTVVTVATPTFALPYFDPFRDTFDTAANGWHDVIRLNVERLEERGVYNPYILLRRDSTFDECVRRIEAAPGSLLHFFETLLPYFSSETVGSALATSVMYAGNFVSRIATQQFGAAVPPGAADKVVRKLFDQSSSGLADGGYRLRGVECIFSETRALPRILRSTGLRTPAYWTSRPVFAEPVIAAPPCDIHAEFGIPKDAKILLYAGRPSKNADVLPTILGLVQRRRANERIFLLLIGAHPEDVVAWPGVSAQCSRVRAIPLINRAKLFAIMKSADALVYPGLVDGYPKIISEAGLARLPVVAFNSSSSGLHEMGRNGEIALMIDAASPAGTSGVENEQFAAAVDRVLSERRLRDTLVARAFVAAKRMDAPRFVKRIERRWQGHERNQPGRPADDTGGA